MLRSLKFDLLRNEVCQVSRNCDDAADSKVFFVPSAKAVASPMTEKLKPVRYSAKQTTKCLLTYIDRE